MVYKYFDKKLSGSGVTALANKSAIEKSNYRRSTQVAKELHEPIIKKFKKITVYSAFKDNILGVDLTDMQSISKFNIEDFYHVLLIFLVNILGLFL